MTKIALKCLDLVARSEYRDNLRRVASGQELNKNATFNIGKLLLLGGLFGTPIAMNKLQNMQQESFLKGQSSAANILTPMMAAQYGPQGALGVPQQYRQQFGLQPTG